MSRDQKAELANLFGQLLSGTIWDGAKSSAALFFRPLTFAWRLLGGDGCLLAIVVVILAAAVAAACFG